MTVQEDVRAVSAARDAALVGNDACLIASFMTDDWVYAGPTGATPTADIIGWIASGRLVHHSMTMVGDQRVTPVADTVVSTARKLSSGSWDGMPYTADEVYVQTDGTWRCAFSPKTAALAAVPQHP
jgi:hypothetical protein